MKNILLLICLAFLSFNYVFSKDNPQAVSQTTAPNYTYCEVKTYFETALMVISIDYGDGKKFTVLKDENGKKIGFSGISEMLHDMTKQG
jgi:hypothetical protein